MTDALRLNRLLEDPATPRWLREVDQFLPIKSQFLLHGNIRDRFPWPDEEAPPQPPSYVTPTTHEYLVDYLALKGYRHFFLVNPLHGITLLWPSDADGRQAPHDTAQWVDKQVRLKKDMPDPDGSDAFRFDPDPSSKRWRCRALFPDAVRFAEALVHVRGSRCAIIFDYLMGQIEGGQTSERAPFVRSLIASYEAPSEGGYNTVFWLCDRENDLPAWFTLNNPRIRTIGLPQPDGRTRSLVGGSLLRNLPGFGALDAAAATHVVAEFGQQTDGLLLNDLEAIVRFIPAQGLKVTDVGEAARRYKLGVTEDPWRKVTREHLQRAEALIRTRVKGQERAVQKAMDTLRKSIAGISGAHAGRHSGKPKGVLFFAGPTGVGKTELAKSITEGLFGDETAYIRFDMSEFNHEHADQRLIGAPPGYIGFEAGGELTQAIRERPFSVVLFDEIEKAHPRILDKFLQILDDGQLTSGKGERVYFSDAIIVFTSNLGMTAARPSDEYARLEEKLRQGITEHFTGAPPKGLNRPELLNRIGDNIVIFDYIRPAVGIEILARKVDNVLSRVSDTQGVALTLEGHPCTGAPVPGTAFAFLAEHCATQLDHGGRGIGNLLETVLVDALGRALWDGPLAAGDRGRITGIDLDTAARRYTLRLERA